MKNKHNAANVILAATVISKFFNYFCKIKKNLSFPNKFGWISCPDLIFRIFLFTTEFAPMIDPFPILTPLRIIEPVPIQHSHQLQLFQLKIFVQ